MKPFWSFLKGAVGKAQLTSECNTISNIFFTRVEIFLTHSDTRSPLLAPPEGSLCILNEYFLLIRFQFSLAGLLITVDFLLFDNVQF